MLRFKKLFGTFLVPSVLAAVLILGTFMLGIYIGAKRAPTIPGTTSQTDGKDLRQLFEVWKDLDQKFVGDKKPEEKEKVWGAISGLTASYGDPYTVFFPPAESKSFAEQVSGEFGGVGMEVNTKDGFIVVQSPLKNSPAERAGLAPGDKILKIDGATTAGLSVEDAVKLIRGLKGTTVVLNIFREGKKDSYDVKIVRDTINIPTSDATVRKDGVFVISLYNFSAQSFTAFRESLRDFVKSGSDKLILDLRNNPGGYLEAAVDISSWFLPSGDLIVKEDYAGKQADVVHQSKGYDIFNNKLKMLVLVNGGSASASEILAGALHDQGVARIVGEKTFGKGSVQELINLDGGASLKVTVAHWFTPNGVNISKAGIKPDVEIKMTADDFAKKGDVQLEEAAKLLAKENATSSTAWVLKTPQIIIR